MDVLIYLIPIALALGLSGLVAFFWAARNGQFEDMDGAAYRILHDEVDDDTALSTSASTEAIGKEAR